MDLLLRRVVDGILEERAVSGRGLVRPRGVKRKTGKYKLRKRGPLPIEIHDWKPEIIPKHA